MGVIGELAVNVVADTKKYDSGMRRASKQTKEFKKGIESTSIATRKQTEMFSATARSALKFSAGLAVVTAVVKKTTDSMISMGKAQRELQLRAGQFGIDPDQLKAVVATFKDLGLQADATIDAIQTINERVEEARKGEGTAVEVFQALSINVEKFAKLDVSEKFQRLATAFSKIDDSAKRTLASTDLFGDESSKIAGAFQDVEKFSQQISKNLDSTRISGNLADVATRYEKASNKLSRAMEKFANDSALAKGLAEIRINIVSTLADLVRELAGGRPDRGGSTWAQRTQRMNTELALRERAQQRDVDEFYRRSRVRTRGRVGLAAQGFGPAGPAAPSNIPPGGFRITAGIQDIMPGGTNETIERNIANANKRIADNAMKSFGRIGDLLRPLGPAIASVISGVGNINVPIGPRGVAQEANAALVKGTAEAFSAINRASSPQLKLDEQRNVKLDQLVQNGIQVLQKIGGAGQVILDTVTF